MSAKFDGGNSGSAPAKVESSGRSELMRSLSEQSGRVVEEVRELGRVAVANAGEAASNLRDKGRHAIDAGVKSARKATGQIDDLITENPWKSILISLGVGAIIGFALRRKI